MTYVHQHVSELPDPGGVVECTWATGVELARAALAGSSKQPPATAAEREALRVAGSGSDTKGSTYPQLAAGLAARYGLHVTPTLALPATEIGEGVFLGVQGLYNHLPSQYRKSTFTGAHSLVVFKLGGILKVCDPLTPWNASWHGEPITWAAVVAFHTPLLLGAKVIAVKLPTPPVTSTGGTDVAGLAFDITADESGWLTIEQDGSWGVLVDGTGHVTFNKGDRKRYIARVRLVANYGAAPNTQDGFLVGTRAAVFFARNVTPTPDAAPVVAPPVPDVKHTVTLQFDGGTVFTKVV